MWPKTALPSLERPTVEHPASLSGHLEATNELQVKATDEYNRVPAPGHPQVPLLLSA